MKKTLAILLAAMMLLTCVSCGGKTPENEPVTVPETSESLAQEEQEITNSIPVKYESAFLYGGVVVDNEEVNVGADVDEEITVIRSLEQYMPYVQRAEEALSAEVAWVVNNNISEEELTQWLMPLSALYGVNDALAQYNTESFFKDNVLLLISMPESGLSDVVVTDVCVEESNGSKSLRIDATVVYQSEVIGGGVGNFAFVVALPNDIGVDFDNNVTINRDTAYKSLYLTKTVIQ